MAVERTRSIVLESQVRAQFDLRVPSEGHPKFVALLVGDDCADPKGRTNALDWRKRQLPGVWQDIARMKRSLLHLGFGKIIALGGNGASKGVKIAPVDGIDDSPEENITLRFDGPATDEAIKHAAHELRQHLHAHRTVDDGSGKPVPPIFVLYYSGHGFVDGRVHRLPLQGSPLGEKTGALIDEVVGHVGADDTDRGQAGNGSSLVLLDCCHAAEAIKGARSGGISGPLLDADIREAIRASRKGRFFIGAALRDEQAWENDRGGVFTAALCALLSADRLGEQFTDQPTLSLDHLVLAIEKTLAGRHSQAVARESSRGDDAWDSYVLFQNPHYRPVQELLRFQITISPETARLRAKIKNQWQDLETLGFIHDESESDTLRRVYQIPGAYRGKTLRIRAEPDRPQDRNRYRYSVELSVRLELRSDGSRPTEALSLRELATAEAPQADAILDRARAYYTDAQNQTDPLEKYRQLQAVQALLQDTSDPFLMPIRQNVESDLAALRPKAGHTQLAQLIQKALAPAQSDRYREAYDRLNALIDDHTPLKEFDLTPDTVQERIQREISRLLETWETWAISQCRAAAVERGTHALDLFNKQQYWLAWKPTFEARVLIEPYLEKFDIAPKFLSKLQSNLQTITTETLRRFCRSQVSLQELIDAEAYGVLQSLIAEEKQSAFSQVLTAVLKKDFDLDEPSLERKIRFEKTQFKEQYADWFPPVNRLAYSPPAPSIITSPSIPADLRNLWEQHETRLKNLGFDIERNRELVIRNPKDDGVALWVPPGDFLMGKDKKPQSIREGFYLDLYPVTVAQYQNYVRTAGGTMPEPPGWGWQNDHPIVNVHWDDAKSYCEWTGKRLPSEEEWEYAARGTDGRIYPWGNETPTEKRAVCRPAKSTAPVGSHPDGASPFGFQDMAGNVWEWSSGFIRKTNTVSRGGSWYSLGPFLRCANRYGNHPAIRSSYIGFRCARHK